MMIEKVKVHAAAILVKLGKKLSISIDNLNRCDKGRHIRMGCGSRPWLGGGNLSFEMGNALLKFVEFRVHVSPSLEVLEPGHSDRRCPLLVSGSCCSQGKRVSVLGKVRKITCKLLSGRRRL